MFNRKGYTMKRQEFDATPAFREEIEPLLKELIALCSAHGVPLTAMLTYKLAQTPCTCGNPDCVNVTDHVEACSAVFGSTVRMVPLQHAIAELCGLPEKTRDEFIGVILLTSAAVDSGVGVNVHTGVAETQPPHVGRWN